MTIAYIRVSTEDQATNGYGLEAQREAIEHYLKKKPDAEYQDDISGKRADRPGLLAALNALKSGDVLIVAKRDRLSRDVYLSCWIEKEVKKRGASIISAAGEGTENDNPASILMRHMVDAFAEYERAMISMRTKAAFKVKRSKNEFCGGNVPYGYERIADGFVTVNGKQKTRWILEENKKEQAAISRILSLYKSGHTLIEISFRLDGYARPRTGKSWKESLTLIRKIIKRETKI